MEGTLLQQYDAGMSKPTFNSPEKAIETTFTMLARLASVVVWIGLLCMHMLFALLLLALAWATQTTGADTWAWLQTLLQTMPAAVLSAVGVSILSLLGGYLWLLRKIHQHIGTVALPKYLLKYD